MKTSFASLAVLPMLACSPSPSAQVQAAEDRGAFEEEVSFSHDIQPVVKNFCTTCHAGDDPEGDLVLTSYEAVREHTEHGDLLARINDPDDPMPEDGLMPRHMRRLFQSWAEKGYLNQGTGKTTTMKTDYEDFNPAPIQPIDIQQKGFELLESMQGHWVGSMHLMGTDYDWMAFDYRPIAPAHVHGIFEGGTIGNLFTSFFVTEFNGVRTIMARNGGLLNGIYRTSYFVLDRVSSRFGQRYYRLVDARGGADIMYMELTFSGRKLEFNAYTSRFGLKTPQLHMAFQGVRKRPELAAAAARVVGFPNNEIDFEFPAEWPTPTWVGEYPWTSLSYMHDEKGMDLMQLAKASLDPRTLEQTPHLSQLTVSIQRSPRTQGKKLHLYLSQEALTDERGRFITQGGYVRMDLLDSLLTFPELSGKTDEFTFTYLHPGDYFLTVVADMDGDGYPSPGDITHPVTPLQVAPESTQQITIDNLTVQN